MMLFGRESRDVAQQIIGMLKREPFLAEAWKQIPCPDSRQDQVADILEEALQKAYAAGMKDREKEPDFQRLRDTERRQSRESWERERLHGDIDI